MGRSGKERYNRKKIIYTRENVYLSNTLPEFVYQSVRDVVVQKLLEWDHHLDEVQRAPEQGEKRQH